MLDSAKSYTELVNSDNGTVAGKKSSLASNGPVNSQLNNHSKEGASTNPDI